MLGLAHGVEGIDVGYVCSTADPRLYIPRLMNEITQSEDVLLA